MNTTPDNETILLWLEDELEGADLAVMDAWAGSQPQLLSRRAELRQWKQRAQQALLMTPLPAAEMFHAALARAIQQNSHQSDSPIRVESPSPTAGSLAHSIGHARPRQIWQRYASAAALIAIGMGLGFLVANHSRNAEPATVYTPEQGVHANVNNDSPADATVIVLDGAALSDNIEITETNAQTPAPSQSEMSQSLRLSP